MNPLFTRIVGVAATAAFVVLIIAGAGSVDTRGQGASARLAFDEQLYGGYLQEDEAGGWGEDYYDVPQREDPNTDYASSDPCSYMDCYGYGNPNEVADVPTPELQYNPQVPEELASPGEWYGYGNTDPCAYDDSNCYGYGGSEDPCAYNDCNEQERLGIIEDEDDFDLEVEWTRRSEVTEEETWFEKVVSYSECTYFGWGCEEEEREPWYREVYTEREPYTVATWTETPVYSYTTGGPYYQMATPRTVTQTRTVAQQVAAPVRTVVQATPPTTTPPPSCEISFSPNAITAGESTTLIWQADNASSAQMTDVGRVATNGIRGLTPRETRTMTLTVYGQNGSQRTCSATIRVQSESGAACSIAASPTRIEQGNGTTLTWSASNAARAALSGVGDVEAYGSRMVYPDKSTTYELRALGRDNQTRSCTAYVEVVPRKNDWFDFSFTSLQLPWTSTSVVQQQTIVTTPPTTGSGAFTSQVVQPPAEYCRIASSVTAIQPGGFAVIEWTVPPGLTGTITGLGSVTGSGYRSVAPTGTTVYTLTIPTQTGVRTCSATVSVVQAPPPMPTCSATVTPTQTTKEGTVTLSWTTQRAIRTELSGVGPLNLNGSTRLLPGYSRTYTVVVYDALGRSNICTASVTVPYTGGTGPSCTISADPASIQQGGRSTLSWRAYNATSATITQGIGTVSTTGSQSVTPKETTVYTMTVQDAKGTKSSCSATVKLEGAQTCTLVCGGQTYICTPTSGAQLCPAGTAPVSSTQTQAPAVTPAATGGTGAAGAGTQTGATPSSEEDSGFFNWWKNLF